MTAPPPTNGKHVGNSARDDGDPGESDAKFLFIIMGGIVSAFLIGIVVLVIALASDWNG